MHIRNLRTDSKAAASGFLAADGGRSQGELTARDIDLGLVHTRAAIMVGAPGVIVAVVLIEVALGVEGCARNFPTIARKDDRCRREAQEESCKARTDHDDYGADIRTLMMFQLRLRASIQSEYVGTRASNDIYFIWYLVCL
jgi:hypothetical protein